MSRVDTEPRLGVSLGVTAVEMVVEVGAILLLGWGSLSAPASVLPLQRSVSHRHAVTRDEDESEMS